MQSSKMMFVNIIFSGKYFICILSAAHQCLLKGSNAHCKVEIADRLHGEVYVNVDTCSKPVDVTISIQVN